jgi:DNA-binding response OmpR family regulator
MKQNILVLDDLGCRHAVIKERYSNHNVVSAYTYDQFVELLGTHKWDLILLDHDLGDYEYTGQDAAKHIAKHYSHKETEITVHSWNPDGSRRMVSILRESGFTRVCYIPF